MKSKAYAVQIADAINIKACKNSFEGNLMFYDNDELFYESEKEQFIYIFKYGIVCFYNISDSLREKTIKNLLPHCKNAFEVQFSDEIIVETTSEVTKISYDCIELTTFNLESVRLVMLNLSQSVALEKYSEIAYTILDDTNKHTIKLDIGGNKLKKYIGKILNIKNKISENLYIFDSHDFTWGDETLNKLDQNLKSTFDLKDRSRSIQEQLGIIKENLDLFKDIMFHRESSNLEWIIILLILVEVMDMFILRFL